MNEVVDTIGTEVYTAHYHERRVAQRALIALIAFAAIECIGIVYLASRPAITRYVRIDEIGRAMPIAYNDLNYTPREGEIRTFLSDWATFRYTRLSGTVAKAYPKNYFFLNDPLAQSLMAADTKAHTVASVVAGTAEENDVEITNVTFTSLGKEQIRRAAVYTGTGLIDLVKIFSASTPVRRERWQIAVTFYLNPAAVSERAKTAPEFELVNPLGLIITDFHESRVSE